jgi:5-formyltetrahydrofolate cyclo-ligase
MLLHGVSILPQQNGIRAQKRSLRETAKQLRRDVSSEQRAIGSFNIAEQLAELPEFKRARFAHIYCSFGSEVETGVVFSRSLGIGQRIIVPITPVSKHYRNESDEDSKILLHTEITEEQSFGFDRHGLPAPLPLDFTDPTATLDYLMPARILTEDDIIIVPLVAFDENCYRLGYGQGYYDRFLSTLTTQRCVRIGIAFECQRIDAVPVEPHDEPLDIVVSEKRVYRRKVSNGEVSGIEVVEEMMYSI